MFVQYPLSEWLAAVLSFSTTTTTKAKTVSLRKREHCYGARQQFDLKIN